MQRQSHAIEFGAQLSMILGFFVPAQLAEGIMLHFHVLIKIGIHECLGTVGGARYESHPFPTNSPPQQRVAKISHELHGFLALCGQLRAG
jgi:hypothetical protein